MDRDTRPSPLPPAPSGPHVTEAPGPTPPPPSGIVERVTALARLAEEVQPLLPSDGPVGERARRLVHHVRSYLVPRARSLDAPLVVVLLGPTGAGKSTLFNTLVGSAASTTGVLRPTTREAVLAATPTDASALMGDGPLAEVATDRIEHADAHPRPGVAIVDAPDIDSIERDNRRLADLLVEAADLCVFVTTATRYADDVPWQVLARVRERRLPLVVVVNRLPTDRAQAQLVLDDVSRLMTDASMGQHGAVEVLSVPEGDLAPEIRGLRPGAVAPLLARVDALAADRDARRTLAGLALAGALAGVGSLVHGVADDLEHRAIDADALRRIAHTTYAEELDRLRAEIRTGHVLRQEVLAQWHSFVGADQVTRLFSSGIGRLRGTVAALVRGTPPPPVAAVSQGATTDLAAVTQAHAADAARRTAAHWADQPIGSDLVAGDPSLWGPTAELRARLEGRLGEWIAGIAHDVQTTGASKRSLARGASLGVNAAGVTVMLSVFAHTGGLTGAEVGVAAGTAFLNQKLLHALFGEASVREMIDRARRRLDELLEGALTDERARFDRLAPDGAILRDLAAQLRTSVADIAP